MGDILHTCRALANPGRAWRWSGRAGFFFRHVLPVQAGKSQKWKLGLDNSRFSWYIIHV